MRRGANRIDLGRYNALTVIHALRSLGPASQGEIARETGLSVPTVSSIVRSRIASGHLREVRSESSGRGRPRSIVGIVPDAAFSVGVHIEPALLTAVLLDMSGEVREERRSTAVDPEHPGPALDAASRLVAELREAAGPADRVAGAGLAAPGRVDGTTGSMVDPVWLPGWHGVPIAAELTARTGLPVRVLKDTLAAVTGEIWVRGRELMDATTVFVYLGAGTGLGLAVAGEPVDGSSGNAGETGRLFELLSPATSHAPLTATAQDPARLVEAAHERGILAGPAPRASDMAAVERSFRQLCEAAVEPASPARWMLEQAAGRVTQVAGIAADLLDAQCIVLGGPFWPLVASTYGPEALAQLQRGDSERQVLVSALGPQAGAIGAASAVLEAAFVPRGPGAPAPADPAGPGRAAVGPTAANPTAAAPTASGPSASSGSVPGR